MSFASNSKMDLAFLTWSSTSLVAIITSRPIDWSTWSHVNCVSLLSAARLRTVRREEEGGRDGGREGGRKRREEKRREDKKVGGKKRRGRGEERMDIAKPQETLESYLLFLPPFSLPSFPPPSLPLSFKACVYTSFMSYSCHTKTERNAWPLLANSGREEVFTDLWTEEVQVSWKWPRRRLHWYLGYTALWHAQWGQPHIPVSRGHSFVLRVLLVTWELKTRASDTGQSVPSNMGMGLKCGLGMGLHFSHFSLSVWMKWRICLLVLTWGYSGWIEQPAREKQWRGAESWEGCEREEEKMDEVGKE